MKIILFSLFAIFVTASNNSDKMTNRLDLFCSGVNKNVCTNELIQYGSDFFFRRLKEISNEVIRRRKKQRQDERKLRIKQIREQQLLTSLRERFLDRHL